MGVPLAVKASGTRAETERVGSKECFQLPEFCTWHVSCAMLYPVCNNNSGVLSVWFLRANLAEHFLPFP